MKNHAVRLNQFGSLDNLSLGEFDLSKTNDNDVVIEVYCSGISFADILVVEGKYQDNPPIPFVPGVEVSGVVVEIGKKVNDFQIGDEVVALTNWGGFSEFVKVNSKFVEIKSEEMPFDVAASMTVNYGTSYHALVERADVQSNQDILILGASGGLGLAAIEISKAYGCRVTAVASSEEKLLVCKQYGADKLILNKDDNLKGCLKNNSAGKFDVIYDSIGGQSTVDSLSFIKWKGIILIMGFASGDIPAPPLNKILLKGCSLVGVFWGPFAKGNDDFNLECIKKINHLYDTNLIKIAKPELFLINQFKEALLKIKNRKSIGKLCFYTNSYMENLPIRQQINLNLGKNISKSER